MSSGRSSSSTTTPAAMPATAQAGTASAAEAPTEPEPDDRRRAAAAAGSKAAFSAGSIGGTPTSAAPNAAGAAMEAPAAEQLAANVAVGSASLGTKTSSCSQAAEADSAGSSPTASGMQIIQRASCDVLHPVGSPADFDAQYCINLVSSSACSTSQLPTLATAVCVC